ncbi:MAG: ABC transporter ATP-binding protein [Chloroflexi bacterium]|nr:ABC transporter ATP-binding protein [Chloroflexota bacterium]
MVGTHSEGQDAVIRVRDLRRVYAMGRGEVAALKGVTLDVPAGAMTAIVGRSGSGKTTLLNLLAGLDRPSAGEVWFRDLRLDALPEPALLRLRQDRFGFVFQAFGLLPLLSAAENIAVPLRMRQFPRDERERRVQAALDWVGLTKRAKHRPYELSGGEQQRVAIARALAAEPELILADEPTGQLDSSTGRRILHLLRRVVDERGVTVVVVTHEPQVMSEADVLHELQAGELVDTRYRLAMSGAASI